MVQVRHLYCAGVLSGSLLIRLATAMVCFRRLSVVSAAVKGGAGGVGSFGGPVRIEHACASRARASVDVAESAIVAAMRTSVTAWLLGRVDRSWMVRVDGMYG